MGSPESSRNLLGVFVLTSTKRCGVTGSWRAVGPSHEWCTFPDHLQVFTYLGCLGCFIFVEETTILEENFPELGHLDTGETDTMNSPTLTDSRGSVVS